MFVWIDFHYYVHVVNLVMITTVVCLKMYNFCWILEFSSKYSKYVLDLRVSDIKYDNYIWRTF